MAGFPLTWLMVAATLGWCGAALRVSFTMALRGGGSLKKLVVTGPFLMLPFILLSALLPWANVRVTLNFTLCWVTPCKLLLLASANFLLDCRSWSLSHFSHFLLALLLPVRITGPVKGTPRLPQGSLHALLLHLCVLFCYHSLYDTMAPPVSHVAHCLILYLVLDLPHRIASMALLLLYGVETKPAFRKPWLSTSLTDFWGKRWNLTANALLRHSVYNPIVNLLIAKRAAAGAGRKNDAGNQLRVAETVAAAAAPTSCCSAKMHVEATAVPAACRSPHAAPIPPLVTAPFLADPLPLSVRLISVNSTFFVSGLIHEFMYFSLTGAEAPTWEVSAFFIVHGLAVSAEISLRRACPKHAIFKLPRSCEAVLTMCFLCATSAWLFFPQLDRANLFRKGTAEFRALASTLIAGTSTRLESVFTKSILEVL